MNKKNEKFLSLYLMFHIIPASMAVLGALFKLPHYYYSIFKIVMIIADSGVINIIMSAEIKSDTAEIIYLASCIVTFIITMLGIISEFSFGFSREFWIVLDYIYATAKIIQLKIVSKDN